MHSHQGLNRCLVLLWYSFSNWRNYILHSLSESPEVEFFILTLERGVNYNHLCHLSSNLTFTHAFSRYDTITWDLSCKHQHFLEHDKRTNSDTLLLNAAHSRTWGSKKPHRSSLCLWTWIGLMLMLTRNRSAFFEPWCFQFGLFCWGRERSQWRSLSRATTPTASGELAFVSAWDQRTCLTSQWTQLSGQCSPQMHNGQTDSVTNSW